MSKEKSYHMHEGKPLSKYAPGPGKTFAKKHEGGRGYATTGGNSGAATKHPGHFKGKLVGGTVPEHHRGHKLTHHSGHEHHSGVPGHKDGHHGNTGHSMNHTHKIKGHENHNHGAFLYHPHHYPKVK